ncbi:transposase [Paenibacillus rhizovicinus]|uniref:Transposase n=1 Tax=Paenibacillus rhizovicinus TaxID=2704463 RepID=A0A6C0P1D6_9BACL|nr:transposase [Paenibacillus rhizovicinus]QHW32181.1 transposase [Paenibacillus rhizovicinus]
MRGTLAEQEQATIYQYQLKKKIFVREELYRSYLCAILILAAFLILMYRLEGVKAFGIGILCSQFVHFFIIRLTLIRVDEPDYRRWGWRVLGIWIGYIPVAYIELGLFRRVHRHLFWLGLCAISVIYPWANEATMISLVMCHIWFLAPRLVTIRWLRKSKRDGVLKITANEVSYYHR